MTGKREIETVVCPEERLPEFFRKKPRFGDGPRNNSSWPSSSSPSSSSFQSSSKKDRPTSSAPSADESSKSVKDELKGIMKSIKQFNTEAQQGKEKRKSAQDRLTALGAMPLKQQKMPLKMRLAIMQSREKKQRHREEIERQSEVVTVNTLKKIRERKAGRKSKK